MRITGPAVKFTLFVVVMSLLLFAIVTVFGNLRFGSEKVYRAVFDNVSGLAAGQFVRIAGVESGKVKSVSLTNDSKAEVSFSVTGEMVLTRATHALVRYENLVGDRYLELSQGPGSGEPLPEGGTIPLSNTAPALDIDSLIGGFRPLFKALDPDQVNQLSSELIAVLQGQDVSITNFLTHTASLTAALADRDELIGSVIGNLNAVLGTVDDKNAQFDSMIDNLQALISGIAGQADPVGDALAGIGNASGSAADLMNTIHPTLRSDVAELGRVSTVVDEDAPWVDNLLAILPDRYQRLSRLGLTGDFFSFYLCDAILKVNGPNGDPVYIDVVGQRAGRCTPPK